MDMRLLTYFVVIAEERSITRAAQRLHVAQPSLSQQLRRLERDVGAHLVDRTARPLTLTSAGRRLLADAYRLLRLAAESRRAVAALGAGASDEITLCLPVGGFHATARQALAAMATDRPDIRVTPVLLPDTAMLPALSTGDIDVGLVRDTGTPLPPGVAGHVLADEKLLVVLPEQHRLARRRRVRLTELSDEDFITFPRRSGPAIFDRQTRLCRDAGFEPRPGPEVDDPQARDLLITLGHGVALVGAGASARLPGVVLRPVDPPTTLSVATAVRSTTTDTPTPVSPAVRALLTHLRHAARRTLDH